MHKAIKVNDWWREQKEEERRKKRRRDKGGKEKEIGSGIEDRGEEWGGSIKKERKRKS